jgi:adenylate kinase family enzyme
MKDTVMIGRPGSGKSTIARAIAEKLGAVYVSTGDIARRLAETDDLTKYNLAHGMMAPENMIRSELFMVLYDITYRKQPFILDGFPRDTDQYIWLRKKFPNCVYVFIDVDEDECFDRLFHRGREDDKITIIQDRLDWYRLHTEPMVSTIGLVHKFTGHNITVDQVLELIK